MKKVKGFAFAGAAVLLSLVMMFVGCTEKLQTNGSASAMQAPASLEQVYEVGLQEESPAQETFPQGRYILKKRRTRRPPLRKTRRKRRSAKIARRTRR